MKIPFLPIHVLFDKSLKAREADLQKKAEQSRRITNKMLAALLKENTRLLAARRSGKVLVG